MRFNALQARYRQRREKLAALLIAYGAPVALQSLQREGPSLIEHEILVLMYRTPQDQTSAILESVVQSLRRLPPLSSLNLDESTCSVYLVGNL